jgi:hypothetical protein
VANRIAVFDVTCPAGTTKTAAQVTSIPWTDGVVTRIEVSIPPGPSGLVGFQILYGPQQIIPDNAGAFIVADDVHLGWGVEGFPTGSAWRVKIYNTGKYDHTLEFRFLINEITPRHLPSLATIPIG